MDRNIHLALRAILLMGIFSPKCAMFDFLDLLPQADMELKPNNPTVCSGQNVTLTCSSKDLAKLNSSQLAFNTSKLHVKFSDKHILNESHAEMTFWNTQPKGKENVCCEMETDSSNFDCQTIFTFDYPLPVVNLTCIVYNWDENMNCTWQPGTDYEITPIPHLAWRLRAYKCQWSECPNSDKQYNSCYWSSTKDGQFSTKIIDIRMNVTSRCGMTATTFYSINTKTIVKPAAVDNLNSKVINSTCINVTWEASRREYVKIYEAWHTSIWGTSQPVVMDRNTTGMNTYNEEIFCELHPATKYTFHIHVKPGRIYWSSTGGVHTSCENCSACNNTHDVECECLKNDGYWSEERTVTATTYGDVPNASPEVSPGGYNWDPNECIDGEQHRSASVYWKLLNDFNKNGEIKGYNIKLYSDKEDDSQRLAADTTDYTFKNILCNTDYTVTIQARNENGSSPNSTLQIMDSRKGLYPPHFMAEMSNITDHENKRTVYIQWPRVERPDITGYTVHWCERDKGECAKYKTPFWMSVDKDVNSTKVKLNTPENFLYGVSVDTGEGSSGLTWQSCIYTKDVAPTKSPSKIEVLASNEDRALYVTWSKLTCTSGEPYIDQYVVEYCANGNCNREMTKDNSIILRDLDAEKMYRIKVLGMTMTGEEGPWSETKEKQPEDNSLMPGEIAGIIVGGLFTLALVLAGIIFIYRRCRRWKRITLSPRPVKNILDGIKPPVDNISCDPGDADSTGSSSTSKNSHGYVSQTSTESGYEEWSGSGSPDSNKNRFFNDGIDEEPEGDDKKKERELQVTLPNDYVCVTENALVEVALQPESLDIHHMNEADGQIQPVQHFQVLAAVHGVPVPRQFQPNPDPKERDIKKKPATDATYGDTYRLPGSPGSGSVSPYVTAAAGNSTGSGSSTATSTDQNDNTQATETFRHTNTRIPVPVREEESLATGNPGAGSSYVQVEDLRGGNADFHVVNAEHENRASDYQTMALFDNAAFDPGAFDHQEDVYRSRSSDEPGYTFFDTELPTSQSIDEMIRRTGIDIDQESEHSVESNNDNAYARVIAGDEAGQLNIDNSTDIHDNRDGFSIPKQPDNDTSGDGYVATALADVVAAIEDRVDATDLIEEYMETRDSDSKGSAGPVKANNGYISQKTAENMTVSQEISDPVANTSNGYVPAMFANNSSGYVSEGFADNSNQYENVSRSSLYDVEMLELLEERHNDENEPDEHGTLNLGYVSDSFADGLGKTRGSAESDSEVSLPSTPATADKLEQPGSTRAGNNGYVTQEFANSLANDKLHVAEHNGTISQELAETMSLSSLSDKSGSDSGYVRDSSPDIIRADRNGNVDENPFEYVGNNNFELNDPGVSHQFPTRISQDIQGSSRNGYVSTQFANELDSTSVTTYTKMNLNNDINSHELGAVKPNQDDYVRC